MTPAPVHGLSEPLRSHVRHAVLKGAGSVTATGALCGARFRGMVWRGIGPP
jgi:hypothetical protein